MTTTTAITTTHSPPAALGRKAFTVTEAAQITGLKRATIRKHIRTGLIAASRVGKSYLIPDSVILRMVTAGVIVEERF